MIVLAGILDPIERPLTSVLEWLHTSIGLSWAWAIVALVVMVRIVLVPLTVKQIRSMQKLQQHAPELKAIQQKYKGDKQRMNEEVMKFYRENKVNPAASCLPVVLQIPIFIGLFYTLRDFEKEIFPQYPQSSLGFLNDLVPDITAKVSEHWSGWLLLVVYVGSQLASTLLMSTTMDKRQRMLFLALPFIFVFFIVRFPVGLMIYWVTTNLWTAGQGIVTRRMMPRPAPAQAKKTSRTPPRERQAAATSAKATAATSAKGKAQPKAKAPSAEAAAPATASGQTRRVRRRKKKGPRARR